LIWRVILEIASDDLQNVSITLTPLDVEFFPDGAVDFCLGFSGAEQPFNKNAPFVNLQARAFDERL